MAYANASDLRKRINRTTSFEDEILDEIIAAAGDMIDSFTNHPVGFLADSEASEKVFFGSGKNYMYIPDCVSIVSVAAKDTITDTDYTAWADSDWIAFGGAAIEPDFQPLDILKPYQGLMIDPNGNYSIFPSGRMNKRRHRGRALPMVQISARWGYAAETPAPIREATLMQAARWFKRNEGAMSDALASGELGTLLYRQALDPDIKQILVNGRFMRPRPA